MCRPVHHYAQFDFFDSMPILAMLLEAVWKLGTEKQGIFEIGQCRFSENIGVTQISKNGERRTPIFRALYFQTASNR